MTPVNEHGQPIGDPVEWQPAEPPPTTAMEGRTCRVELLDPVRHAADLHAANSRDRSGALWTYMPYGPFGTEAEYTAWCESVAGGTDPQFLAVVDRVSERAVGVAAYLRIVPTFGVIEVGHIVYSPLLQHTTAATEAMYLMMRRVFDELGYRRYEWKCDALNEPSRRAAIRLGFTFEGVFRQALVYKGRNRDTASYAITDAEWPRIKAGFEAWLDPGNFDASGAQLESLRIGTAS